MCAHSDAVVESLQDHTQEENKELAEIWNWGQDFVDAGSPPDIKIVRVLWGPQECLFDNRIVLGRWAVWENSWERVLWGAVCC